MQGYVHYVKRKCVITLCKKRKILPLIRRRYRITAKLFNSTDKESRARDISSLSIEWNLMSRSEAVKGNPDESEVSYSERFIDKFRSLQYQLHKEYRTERYLRDRLMTEVDINELKEIKDSIMNRIPRNAAHQIENRVANRLPGNMG